jgi:hypothetical protein
MLFSPQSMSAAFAYERQSSSASKAGKVFTLEQMQTLKAIAETILPATETPSGSELDCHGFLDNQVFVSHSDDHAFSLKNFINTLNDHCQWQYGNRFALLNTDLQANILRKIEAYDSFNVRANRSFKDIKSLIVFGYFTSEFGATQALNYDPIPGGYNVIPYNPGDKAWGSHDFY